MTSRKEFLVATSAAVALAPVAALAAPASTSIPPFVFDRATFAAWTTLDTKHHHSFAAIELADGLICDAITNVLNAYEESLGEHPVSISAAAVLYHGSATTLGFNDIVWNEMLVPALPKLPASVREQLGAVKKGDGNRWLHTSNAGMRDASIEKLVSRGASFFVCNNATMGYAEILANALGMTPAAAYAKLASNLVPHAVLVPAGVWAIHALQEAHFTYEQVSL